MSTKMSTKMSTDSSTNEVRSTDDGSQIQTNVEVLNNSNPVSYECDYLVVGAGTCGMSFIDTIFTENSSATVILVDRNDRPGGHWTTAYPFVRLHQPSGSYGVNSERLGKVVTKMVMKKLIPLIELQEKKLLSTTVECWKNFRHSLMEDSRRFLILNTDKKNIALLLKGWTTCQAQCTRLYQVLTSYSLVVRRL